MHRYVANFEICIVGCAEQCSTYVVAVIYKIHKFKYVVHVRQPTNLFSFYHLNLQFPLIFFFSDPYQMFGPTSSRLASSGEYLL
jgi:hypothetical protein